MKRIFSMFVVISILLTMVLPANIMVAASSVSDEGTCSNGIQWTLNDGELVISGMGSMPDWSSEDVPWEVYWNDITSVVIGEGIDTVTDYSFTCIENMKTLSLPSTLETFQAVAVHDCRGLENITVADGNMYFSSEDGVLFDKNKTIIYRYPSGNSRTSYTIPETVTELGYCSFDYNTNLQNVYISKNVSSIIEGTFGINSIKSFSVDDENEYFVNDEDGVLFSADMNLLVSYPCGNERTSYTVPDGVGAIGVDSFNSAMKLTSITLPEGLDAISPFAFANCIYLEEITIPESVTMVGGYAFGWCQNLSKVVFGQYDVEIDSAFNGCSENLTIYGYSGTSVENYAADNNITFVSLGGISTPAVPEIPPVDPDLPKGEGGSGLNTCGDDVTWDFSDGVLTVTGNGAVYDYSWEENYTLNPPPWFDFNNEITEIVLSEGITRIGKLAFVGCASLETISIPTTVTSIGEYAFMECVRLSEISIPENVVSIGEHAFECNESLRQITVLNKNAEFGEAVFAYCSDDLSIYGYEHSTAQNYATSYDIRFVALSENETDNPTDDGVVTLSGVLILPEDYIDSGEQKEVFFWIEQPDGKGRYYYTTLYYDNVDNNKLKYSIEIPSTLSESGQDYTVSVFPEGFGETIIRQYNYYENNGEIATVNFSNGSVRDVDIVLEDGYIISGYIAAPIDAVENPNSYYFALQAWNTANFNVNSAEEFEYYRNEVACEGDYSTWPEGNTFTADSSGKLLIPFSMTVAKNSTLILGLNGEIYAEKNELYDDEIFYVNSTTSSKEYTSEGAITVTSDINNFIFNLISENSSDVPEEDKTAVFSFLVYDNSVASAMLVPIEGATVSITDGQSFSFIATSDETGKVTATLEDGTYTVEVSKEGYETYSEEFVAICENASNTVLIPLIAKEGGGDGTDTPDIDKTVSFSVIDKYTDYPVSNATIVITPTGNSTGTGGTSTIVPVTIAEGMEATNSTSTDEIIITTSDGTASVELENGTYTVRTSADGYVTDTQTIEVSEDEREFQIELERIEFDIASNTTFVVKDGDLETTPVISGASLTIEDTEGNIITKSTDSNGKADANLEDGIYYVTVIADGYKTRSFSIERSDSKNSFTIYLNKDDIITVKSTVKEMTPDEMKDAGIDTDNIGNKQVYNCTAVLSFMPDVSINYYYDSDGKIVNGDKPYSVRVNNVTITPVGRDIYLIVKSNTTWLKETFEVQIICDNTSAVETVEDLTANLTIPEGLSLAIMNEGLQNEATAVLGDVEPKGTTSHKWYICGDEEGTYTLDGTLTGKRTAGGISEEISLTFGIEDSINVLAGSAMKLTIVAETIGTVGEPYYMRYTLENVSDKSLYDLSFSVFGGKFFEDFGVNEIKYAKEYGPDATQDLDGKGFVFETEEFKPDDKVQGVFEIEFGKELLLGEGQEWILKEAFVITGAGSTTEIPTEIVWEYDVPAHDWDEGEVTKAATCTEDGTKIYTCKDTGCEEILTVTISATGHDMGDYVRVEPTCTSEGSETSKCQNEGCDHSVTLPLEKVDHTWETDYTVDLQPTCLDKGSKSIHCANCSATKDEQEVAATGHSYGAWQTRTPATCEGTGVEYRICANGCNIEDTRTVGELGHNFANEWTVDVAAKCEEAGSESRHCSRCSATTDERDIGATGHNFPDEWTTRTEAQCEADGEEYRTCKNGCTKEETRPIEKLGHDWDDGVVTKNPTETESGNKLYTCSRCQTTKNETLAPLVYQEVGFTVPTITITYGDRTEVYNEAYNDSEGGGELKYSSSDEKVATVDENGKITVIGAGETTITVVAAKTDKYLETTADFKLTIKKAALNVTANDAEIFYGEEGKDNGYTATGFVLNETEAVIKGTAAYDVKYEQYGKSGDYEITVSGLSADNYDITFKPGKLTVKKAEEYNIEISNLSQRRGKITEATASVTPKDDTAKIKIEYQFTDGVWVDTIPSDIGIGEYKVRAYLTESENLAVGETPKYFEATLEIKAGAVVNIDGNSDLSIDTRETGDNVEFLIPDEAVEEIINNVPESGEIVIDATGSTGGVTNLTLPENIITALDASENVNTFTVIADDAEISMSADVLKTVADEMSAGDKVNVHIEAVEKESLNEEQKAALDAISTDAHVLQLSLEVQKQDGTTELHELNGNVEVKAAYTLPADMNGKKIVVCYVSDNGTVTYMRATYKDGFVHFKTDHFSHYAIAAIECTHTWDAGTVITQATTSSEGLKRYECTICGETKDETIPKKTSYGGGGGTASYTVKFDTNGAGTIKSQSINKNGIVKEPTAPTKEGYTFEGWYTDEELTTAYDFTTKVTEGFTLYAKWTEVENKPEVVEPDMTISFNDVKADDWFYENVKYVAENNLMNGISENEFAPNNTLTRAMLVTVLYRNAGEPATNRSIPFADVDMGAWYADAVIWAQQNGIVSGTSETTFAPDTNITREQIATIMFRYAQHKGMDAVTLEENLHFTDADEISEYAVSAMNWAVGIGLMKGKSTTTINPKDNATRAEIAAILQRFLETNK